MKTFHTPRGKAGSGQLYGMAEAVRADIKTMFQAGAERSLLDYEHDLTNDIGTDASIRLEVRRRECDARINWSASRAVENALKLIHAYGTDRIIGREFPGVDDAKMKNDTGRGHGLMLLRSMILDDMPDRDMENALEHAYQKAYNSGLRVVTIDDEHMWTMFAGTEDIPLREHATSGITGGEEYTIDHSTVESLLLGAFDKQERTDFSKLPVDTFKQFLEKVDQAYYERDGGNGKRRSLHWELYSARDHERARPYVVAGMSFFSRLAKELVKLSRQPWISDKDRLVREYERLNYNVKQLMKNHAIQYFRDEIEFPPMVPPAELAGRLREWIPNAKADVKRGYGYLRQKQSWVTKKND